MLIYTTAENYIRLNLPKMFSELTKDDKESYVLSIKILSKVK